MKQIILVNFPIEQTVSKIPGLTEDQKEYAYFAAISDDIQIGDHVVVFARKMFKCAQVTKVRGLTKAQQEKATKWIVQKVDLKTYKINMKREEVAQEIRNTLREEKERMEEILIYEKLAKDNPKMAQLLTELKAIETGEKDIFLLGE